MTIIIVIILIMEMQPAVTAPAVWYLQTCLGLSWCSLLPVKRHPFTPMSIEEAAQASTLKGSSDAPIETEETAEETAEVKSFEVAAAETSEMRNQPYNAADWMQPAAARWLLAPSSKLARWESCDLLLTRFVQRKYENSRRLYEKTSLLICLNIKLNVECCKKFISFPVPCFGDLLQTPFVIATPRLYFHIGPRCWSIATTIAVGATVLGRDSHPGYKLLASAVPWQNSTPRLLRYLTESKCWGELLWALGLLVSLVLFPADAHDSTLLGGEAKWKRSGRAEYMVYRQMAWYWNTADAYQLVALVVSMYTWAAETSVLSTQGCKLVVAGAEGG